MARREFGQFDIGGFENFFLEFLGGFRVAVMDRLPDVHVVLDLVPRDQVPHAEELMHRFGDEPAAVTLALGARVSVQRRHLHLAGRLSRRRGLLREATELQVVEVLVCLRLADSMLQDSVAGWLARNFGHYFPQADYWPAVVVAVLNVDELRDRCRFAAA